MQIEPNVPYASLSLVKLPRTETALDVEKGKNSKNPTLVFGEIQRKSYLCLSAQALL